MKSISKEAGTTNVYTNHCIKATTGTVLKKSGIAVHDIMAVTGHKNPTSLQSYVQGPDHVQRENMSNILALLLCLANLVLQ